MTVKPLRLAGIILIIPMKNHLIRKIFWFYLIITLLSLIPVVTACSSLSDEPVYLTATSSTTPFPSATIEWFPATSTATLVPTIPVNPTENLHPSVGGVLFEEDFNNTENWSLVSEEGGRISLGRNELTLAVQEPRTYIASLNSAEVLQDAWVELSTNVTLCKAEDSYGILLRAGSPMDAYRFAVNCQGQVRLERMNFGRPTPLLDWMQSGQVLPGSPQSVRLQVWVVQNELRFFVNDVFQYSVRDATLTSGKMGVFAYQAADTPLTVSFSDIVIRSIQPGYILPKATALPTATAVRRVVPPSIPTAPSR